MLVRAVAIYPVTYDGIIWMNFFTHFFFPKKVICGLGQEIETVPRPLIAHNL